MLLRNSDEYVPAYFHADCGGSTSDGAASGFGNSPVLKHVKEAKDSDHVLLPHTWRERIDAEKLDALSAKFNVGEHATGLQILERDPGGRVLQAKLTGSEGSFEIPGEELRRLLSLPSAMIDLLGVLRDGSLIIEGRGRGHGIGLCQIGAQALAKKGKTCVEILEHYYPGARIELLAEPIRSN
jgi:stage II sporulation protein D